VGSEAGLSDEKIQALDDWTSSPLFDSLERTALEYAEAITLSEQDVSDELFARLKEHFSTEAIVELTAVIAWENASSKFNRALRVESQNLYAGSDQGEVR
jgi:alkylhydroperoxidase family enzyme